MQRAAGRVFHCASPKFVNWAVMLVDTDALGAVLCMRARDLSSRGEIRLGIAVEAAGAGIKIAGTVNSRRS
jgi:hypothetical protein